jgi:hypothetical protein
VVKAFSAFIDKRPNDVSTLWDEVSLTSNRGRIVKREGGKTLIENRLLDLAVDVYTGHVLASSEPIKMSPDDMILIVQTLNPIRCMVCRKELREIYFCGGCKLAAYCSKEHAEVAWAHEHRFVCPMIAASIRSGADYVSTDRDANKYLTKAMKEITDAAHAPKKITPTYTHVAQ